MKRLFNVTIVNFYAVRYGQHVIAKDDVEARKKAIEICFRGWEQPEKVEYCETELYCEIDE